MPDEKRIKDFEPATELLIDDWFAVDSPSQGTRKIQKSMFMADEIASLQALSTAMGGAQTDISNLQTRAGMSQNLNFGDNLTDGVNILSVLLGAEPYVNTRTYAVGEYCIYEKELYKCTTAVTSAEDFDSNKWTLTNVKTELTELNSSKANKQWTRVLQVDITSNTDQTVQVTYPDNYSELLFTIQRLENGRTIGTNIIPKDQFNGGACYVSGAYNIVSLPMNNISNEFINGVFLYVSDSSIEVAVNKGSVNLRARVFAR